VNTSTSQYAKSILLEIIKLLRLTSKVPKIIPVLKFMVLLVYFYELYSSDKFKSWWNEYIVEPIKTYNESCKEDYESYEKRNYAY
jgi:hypothetical protein